MTKKIVPRKPLGLEGIVKPWSEDQIVVGSTGNIWSINPQFEEQKNDEIAVWDAQESFKEAVQKTREGKDNCKEILNTLMFLNGRLIKCSEAEGLRYEKGIGFEAAGINKKQFLEIAEKRDSVSGCAAADSLGFWLSFALAEADGGEDSSASLGFARMIIDSKDYEDEARKNQKHYLDEIENGRIRFPRSSPYFRDPQKWVEEEFRGKRYDPEYLRREDAIEWGRVAGRPYVETRATGLLGSSAKEELAL